MMRKVTVVGVGEGGRGGRGHDLRSPHDSESYCRGSWPRVQAPTRLEHTVGGRSHDSRSPHDSGHAVGGRSHDVRPPNDSGRTVGVVATRQGLQTILDILHRVVVTTQDLHKTSDILHTAIRKLCVDE